MAGSKHKLYDGLSDDIRDMGIDEPKTKRKREVHDEDEPTTTLVGDKIEENMEIEKQERPYPIHNTVWIECRMCGRGFFTAMSEKIKERGWVLCIKRSCRKECFSEKLTSTPVLCDSD